jgi:hypothetical protein
MNKKISRDALMLMEVELRNEGGTQPPTLGSTYESFIQAPTNVLLSWMGYKEEYAYSPRLLKELGIELRRLIRKYGKKAHTKQFVKEL